MRNAPLFYKTRSVFYATCSTGSMGTNVGNWTLAFNFNGKPGSTNTSDTMIFEGDPNNPVGHSFQGISSVDDIWSTVRCAAVQFKFIPSAPNNASTSTQKYTPVYIAYDRDGHEENLSAQLSEEAMLRNETVKIKDFNRPWKYFCRAPKYNFRNKMTTYYNAGGYSDANIAGMWHNFGTATANTSTNNGYHILMNSYNNGATQWLGTIIVTAYFVAKDRLE